ncbi:MAG: TetR/AcrR family transcriptional regulator [Rhodospirillales bacterium]|nr:TetR/AcrR family transcriptional regulator [Rhodospirillales bacterium]
MPQQAAAATSAGGQSRKTARILDAAREMFLAHGFGATSMDALARCAGVSKATIYAYFDGKEALFAALVSEECARLDGEIATSSATGESPGTALPRLAGQFLALLLSPWALAIHRVVVAEAPRFPELGIVFYRAGCAAMKARLEAYLRQAVARGELVVPDPALATTQLIGLIRGDLQLRCLLEPSLRPSPAEIDRYACAAVDVFLAAYGKHGTGAA